MLKIFISFHREKVIPNTVIYSIVDSHLFHKLCIVANTFMCCKKIPQVITGISIYSSFFFNEQHNRVNLL